MVHHAGAISRKACNNLSHWAQGTRRHLPRPAYYHVLANQVRGASSPNLVPLDLEEQCHVFRPVVVAATVDLDDNREPRQLVIACKKKQLCMYWNPFFLAQPSQTPTHTHTGTCTPNNVHSKTVENISVLAIFLMTYTRSVIFMISPPPGSTTKG